MYWAYNPLILTIDPNFQRDIQVTAGWPEIGLNQKEKEKHREYFAASFWVPAVCELGGVEHVGMIDELLEEYSRWIMNTGM